jgi:hypothetical protein
MGLAFLVGEEMHVLTAAAAPLVFDGRDVADAAPSDEDVSGYAVVTCQVCGTERDGRYPYCCEFAAVDAAERTLVTC